MFFNRVLMLIAVACVCSPAHQERQLRAEMDCEHASRPVALLSSSMIATAGSPSERSLGRQFQGFALVFVSDVFRAGGFAGIARTGGNP